MTQNLQQEEDTDEGRPVEIDAALAHFRVAQSHLEQGIEHLTAEEGGDDDDYGFTLTCDDCDAAFDPYDVTHSIVGPHTALYSCPNCSKTIRGPEPYLRDLESDD
jgi:hypothetical protein